MTYTPEDKLNIVYKAFLPYIREHTYFDIVYSEKIGFIQLPIKEEYEALRLQTWEDLLKALCHEIALDVIMDMDKDKQLSEMIRESCQRTQAILNEAEDCREELISHAEKYIYSFLQREDA